MRGGRGIEAGLGKLGNLFSQGAQNNFAISRQFLGFSINP